MKAIPNYSFKIHFHLYSKHFLTARSKPGKKSSEWNSFTTIVLSTLNCPVHKERPRSVSDLIEATVLSFLQDSCEQKQSQPRK